MIFQVILAAGFKLHILQFNAKLLIKQNIYHKVNLPLFSKKASMKTKTSLILKYTKSNASNKLIKITKLA